MATPCVKKKQVEITLQKNNKYQLIFWVFLLGGFAVDLIDVDVLWLQILLLILAIVFLVLWMRENRKTQN
ncbi:MAG: hypothetical protein CMG58_06435 [Candidatus Marinimicrobia bacterium]|nr:hypothetical protein [Candidatus Neomarinimicrobiota bacterium]